jgi:hypothetical protein
MSDLDPNESTTTTDLDPTTSVPTPTSPVAPTPVIPAPVTPAPLTPPVWGDAAPSYPTPQPFEPAVAWAPAVPVSTAPARRRGGRLRWAAAIAIVAVIVGASAAVAALVTNSQAQSTILGYVPSGSIAYGEVRLDLPGDQRQAVGAFLSKFPGFHDQAALDTKLDEILDQFIKKATNDKQTYTADIKPWFGGEVALTVGPLPPAASMSDPARVTNALRALALLSVTDPAAADAWIDKTIAASGAKTTTEIYNGVTLTILAQDTGPKIAYAVIGDKVAALGDLTSVKAAVDTGGKSGFASEPGPKAALASSSGDHVGFIYLALEPLLDWSTELNKAAASQSGATVAALDDSIKQLLPAWTAGWLSFDDDAMVIESTTPKAQTPIGPTENRTSVLARHIPSTAIATSISNDLGKTIDQALTLYASQPAYKAMLDQVDKTLGLIGGRAGAIGWIGDTALVVNDAGDTLEGGIVIDPTDSAAAGRLAASLQAVVGLGGASQGITVHDESYNGTTITIVDLGDASKLSGGAGSMVLPLPTGHIQIAYAVTDDVVAIGTGPAFVKHVLDTTEATSLASDPQYKRLADRVGAGTSSAFVDIAAVRALAEKAMAGGGQSGSKYETDVKPFLIPFDALYASNSTSSDLNKSTVIITVK